MLNVITKPLQLDPGMARRFFSDNPIILISGERPGTGATTLARGIGEKVLSLGFNEIFIEHIGQVMRDKVGARGEEELGTKLNEIDDPLEYDVKFYSTLPRDRTCIIEGKLASAVGPYLAEPDRKILSIYLTGNSISTGLRVMKRECLGGANGIFSDANAVLAMLQAVKKRQEHTTDMSDRITSALSDKVLPRREDILNFSIDTCVYSSREITDLLFGEIGEQEGISSPVSDWEIRSLIEAAATISQMNILINDGAHSANRSHFDHNFESLRYNISRLKMHKDPGALADIRLNVKKALADCWLGQMMKEMPRFFTDIEGNLSADELSHRWTPEYYKIAAAWPLLKEKLKDKAVLDPFGGTGTMMYLLAARGIIRSGCLTDISYLEESKGRAVSLDKVGHYYAVEANRQMSGALFDTLPSWYRPDLGAIREQRFADAKDLPYEDKKFDYVVTDPPYSMNHDSGGIGVTIGCLPEFERVSRLGSILMVPMKSVKNNTDWAREIECAGFPVKVLTEDISEGNSGIPLRYIHVLPRE